MRELGIFDRSIPVKDYYCSAADEDFYQPMREPKLWLYINVTDRCNGSCRFCVNHSNKSGGTRTAHVDPAKLSPVLTALLPHLSGVSLTGGEPTLAKDAFAEVLQVVRKQVPQNIMLNLATNGTGMEKLQQEGLFDSFSSIHISRHAVSDEKNREIMGAASPSTGDLKQLLAKAEDPGVFVLNCVLQKGGVETAEDLCAYLEMAAGIGIQNVSFIGMFLANSYCREHYVSPAKLAEDVFARQGFRLWNHQKDHRFCSCLTGDYHARSRWIRFYFRCPGTEKADYVRQLLYTADNRLLQGFGGPPFDLSAVTAKAARTSCM
ncbi:MAG: radical SAM protein [Lachnospiraceae bacterium]